MSFRYFRPFSITWQAGMFMIIIGVWLMFRPDLPWLQGIATLISMLAGINEETGATPAPALLIGNGVAMIGMRDKLERMFREKAQ